MTDFEFDFRDFCNTASTLGMRWTDDLYEENGILPCACFDETCPLETVADVQGLIGNVLAEMRPDLMGETGGLTLNLHEVNEIRNSFWEGCKARMRQLVAEGASRMVCNEVAERYGIHE